MSEAQRYAISVFEKSKSQIYITKMALIPENMIQNHRHLINVGKNMIQYLTELNIVLEAESSYNFAPVFNFSAEVQVGN